MHNSDIFGGLSDFVDLLFEIDFTDWSNIGFLGIVDLLR